MAINPLMASVYVGGYRGYILKNIYFSIFAVYKWFKIEYWMLVYIDKSLYFCKSTWWTKV